MDFTTADRITLDYGAAASPKLLGNLSGVAEAGGNLWTVSDEGRSLECLAPQAGGFVLSRSYRLDDLIAGIPGRHDGDELDLESVAVVDRQVWVAGSHCRVRKNPQDQHLLATDLKDRPSRNFLARFDFGSDGVSLRHPAHLPFSGPGSLRGALAADAYLDRFLDLPSKENGLDIEGLAVRANRVLLGLRGPLLDSRAVVIALDLTQDFVLRTYDLHFLDLDGLAIRDLCHAGDEVLVLAGPVSDAPGPFRLYRWTPALPNEVASPTLLAAFPEGTEKPEGICLLARHGRDGLIVLYDKPDAWRIARSRYIADWVPL